MSLEEIAEANVSALSEVRDEILGLIGDAERIEEDLRTLKWLFAQGVACTKHADPSAFVAEFHADAIPAGLSKCHQESRPCILRGFAEGWNNGGKWSIDSLVEAFGDVSVEAMVERCAANHPDRNPFDHKRRMKFSELVRRMRDAPENDVYLTGGNPTLTAHSPLAGMRDWIPRSFPIKKAGELQHVRLWVGAAGTHTELHFDRRCNLLVQVVGSKRVWLLSPKHFFELPREKTFFANLDFREPDVRMRWLPFLCEYTLSEGDAVFIPVAWWHQVLGLSESVSLSIGDLELPCAN